MSYDVYGPYIPVIMMITFIGLFIWVLLPGNKKKYDNAANLPFADDEMEASTEEELRVNDRRDKQ